jgi:hypothetical protein
MVYEITSQTKYAKEEAKEEATKCFVFCGKQL